jgi:hypothetical protein
MFGLAMNLAVRGQRKLRWGLDSFREFGPPDFSRGGRSRNHGIIMRSLSCFARRRPFLSEGGLSEGGLSEGGKVQRDQQEIAAHESRRVSGIRS